MKEVRKLAGQTVIYGLGTIVPRFLNYAILTPFYTREFSKAEYGVITELYAWMVLLQIVLTYGMETGFFRFSQDKENYDKTYSTALISLISTSIVFLVLVFVFISPVSELMNYSENHDYIRMFASILAVDAICAIPFARLRSEKRALLFSTVKILNVVITVLAVIFLIKVAPSIYENSHGWFRKVYNPEYKVGYAFAANLFGSVFTLLVLIPYSFRLKFNFSMDIWKRMINYSFPLLVAGLSGSINDAIDKVMLRRLVGGENGLATVGEYGAGYKLAVLMALFIQMFRYAAEPFFFERAKHEDARETYREVMKYFIIVMLVVFMAINLYIPAIQYILGKSFRDSVIVVPMVSFAYLLYGIYVNHSVWYKINDLTKFGILITLVGAIITVSINLIFVPVNGYIASAWAHLASYLAMLIVSFWLARKHYPVDYELHKVAPYFIIAVLAVVTDIYFHPENDFARIALNTSYMIIFIAYSHYKDKALNLFIIRRR